MAGAVENTANIKTAPVIHYFLPLCTTIYSRYLICVWSPNQFDWFRFDLHQNWYVFILYTCIHTILAWWCRKCIRRNILQINPIMDKSLQWKSVKNQTIFIIVLICPFFIAMRQAFQKNMSVVIKVRNRVKSVRPNNFCYHCNETFETKEDLKYHVENIVKKQLNPSYRYIYLTNQTFNKKYKK